MADKQLVLLDFAFSGDISTSLTGAGDNVYLDASVREQHVTTAEVTQHQVESGSNITDYIRPMPRKVTIEGVITNTPIDGSISAAVTNYRQGTSPQLAASQSDMPAGSVQSTQITVGGQTVSYSALQFSSAFDRVKAVYPSLVSAVLGGALFRIFTTLTVYQDDSGNRNMACINFSVPRDVEHGNAIQFTMDFQEIRIVQTATADVNVPASVSKQKRGQKAPAELKDPDDSKKKSLLKQLVSYAGG